MFVCPIKTHELLDRFASHFLWSLGDPWECSKLNFKILSWVGRLLYAHIAKSVVYDQARVNGRSNYKYPWQRATLGFQTSIQYIIAPLIDERGIEKQNCI